jgi:hypothetical protein
MKHKLFTKFLILLSITTIAFFAFFNYLINPYNIFDHKYLESTLKIKDHSVSIRMTRFYTTIHQKPENLIMGTSRIGMFPLSQVQKYLKNNLYTLAMPGANIEEQTQYLKYMIKNFRLKNIVWSLDFHSFNPDLKNDPSFSYNRLDDSIWFKKDYKVALFSFQTTKNSFKTLIDNLKTENKTLDQNANYADDINNLSHKDIDSRTKIQLQYYPDKFLKYSTFNHPHSIDNNIKKVKNIVNLCKKNNIKLHIYISPVHLSFLKLYSSLNLENTFNYWKEELAKVTNYTDFCTLNSITENRYNFMDGSHLKPMYGKFIFAKIFDDKSVIVPKDFGIHINYKGKN